MHNKKLYKNLIPVKYSLNPTKILALSILSSVNLIKINGIEKTARKIVSYIALYNNNE